MKYAYENVEFSFVSSFRPEPDSWQTRKEYVFSVKPEPAPPQHDRKASAPSNIDFAPSEASKIELVTIRWNGKQCAKQ